MFVNDERWGDLISTHAHTGNNWLRLRLAKDGRVAFVTLHRDAAGCVCMNVEKVHKIPVADAYSWAAKYLELVTDDSAIQRKYDE